MKASGSHFSGIGEFQSKLSKGQIEILILKTENKVAVFIIIAMALKLYVICVSVTQQSQVCIDRQKIFKRS